MELLDKSFSDLHQYFVLQFIILWFGVNIGSTKTIIREIIIHPNIQTLNSAKLHHHVANVFTTGLYEE